MYIYIFPGLPRLFFSQSLTKDYFLEPWEYNSIYNGLAWLTNTYCSRARGEQRGSAWFGRGNAIFWRGPPWFRNCRFARVPKRLNTIWYTVTQGDSVTRYQRIVLRGKTSKLMVFGLSGYIYIYMNHLFRYIYIYMYIYVYSIHLHIYIYIYTFRISTFATTS